MKKNGLKERLRQILNRERARNHMTPLRYVRKTTYWYVWYATKGGRKPGKIRELSGDPGRVLLYANPEDRHPWRGGLSRIKRSTKKVYIAARGGRENAEKQLAPILRRHGI